MADIYKTLELQLQERERREGYAKGAKEDKKENKKFLKVSNLKINFGFNFEFLFRALRVTFASFAYRKSALKPKR
jgi:hypothetical protein